MKHSTKPTARPRLEALESRDVPSYVVQECPGYGVWRMQDGVVLQHMTFAEASLVAVDSAGDVVGEFPGQGVRLYSNGVWEEITANNAASLAMGYSSEATPSAGTFIHIYVVAQFPGQGLWLYDNFTLLNPPGGNSAHSASWRELTANNAATEGVDTNGHVVAEFRGYGVWFYGDSGWRQLTPSDATSVAVGATLHDPSRVVAEFPGYGVWRIADGGGWQQLTAAEALTVGINASGDVAATFPGQGVWSYTDSDAAAVAGWAPGWKRLTWADAVTVGIDANANVYGLYTRGMASGAVWLDQLGVWKSLPGETTAIGVGG
jgi:hypothetical protein